LANLKPQDALHELADRMLQKFLDSELTQPEGRIIGIEEEFRGVLVPGLPDLLGYVDLLLETDDAVIVRDFKTSRSAWDPQQAIGPVRPVAAVRRSGPQGDARQTAAAAVCRAYKGA
jgi:hypothetical protein